MNSHIIYLLVLIISFLNLTNSQNIITSWHYDKVQMYELETIGDLFDDEKLKKFHYDNFTEDSINIKNILITEVQHSLSDSYLNFKTGLVLLTPNKVSLSFSFDYEYGDTKGNATFDLKINMIKMKIKNNKEQQIPSANISGDYSDTDFIVYDINDKVLTEKVKYALYKGFKGNNILNNDILGEIDLIEHYKKKLSTKDDFTFTTSAILGNKLFTIKLNRFLGFCEDVEGKIESALCYYSGEFENEEDKTDRSNAPLNNKDFMDSNDTYNIFINMNLMNKMAEKISPDEIQEFIYDKTKPKKTLSYDFTVKSLKNYFNGLDSYDETLEFSTKIKILKIDITKPKFSVKFNIGETADVFAIDVEFNFGIDFNLKKNVRLNLCMKSVSNINANISSGSITIKDQTALVSAIQESFDFKNYPLCLSEEGVSFRDYFSKITKIGAAQEGLYIFGNQLYQ